MRAVLRLGNALLAAVLALAPASALAQAAPAPASPPPSDGIGPGSLQNFSLSGTVTRPADQPALEPAAKKAQVPPATNRPPAPAQQRSPQGAATASVQAPTRTASAGPSPTPPRAGVRSAAPVATQAATPVVPKTDTASAAGPPSSAIVAPERPSFAPASQSPPQPGQGRSFLLLPWLLAALALGAGGAIIFWRNRVRQALPAGPVFDLFSGPEPAAGPAATQDGATSSPAPSQPRAPEPLFDLLVPKPAPDAPQLPDSRPPPPERPGPSPVAAGAVAQAAARPPAATSNVISTGLRPWVEIGFQPLRCILEDQQIRIEFEIELFNSGSSPARAVLVEAAIVNAGPAQDEQIGAFFASRSEPGERSIVIPPLKRVTIKNMVVAQTDQLHVYELGGRQLFIPLIAFKAFYRWSGGEGQTAVSYLLGRDTKGDKLAPFRRDLGPRIFRNLASRPLPIGVRN